MGAAPPNAVYTLLHLPLGILMATGQDVIGTRGLRNGHFPLRYEPRQSLLFGARTWRVW